MKMENKGAAISALCHVVKAGPREVSTTIHVTSVLSRMLDIGLREHSLRD